MAEDLKAFIGMWVLGISYLCVGYASFLMGQAHMHSTLTNDMKRNNDTPLPAVTSTGKFYLYSQDTKFREFTNKHKEK